MVSFTTFNDPKKFQTATVLGRNLIFQETSFNVIALAKVFLTLGN